MLCLKTSQSNAYSLDTRLDCIMKTSLTMSVSLLITPQRYYFFFTCKLHLIFFQTKWNRFTFSHKIQLKMRFNNIESPLKKETQYIIIFRP